MTGNNRLNVRSVATGKLGMDFREAGRLEAEIKDVRTQDWENRFNLRDITHSAENSLAYNLRYTVGNEDVGVTASATQDQAQIAADVTVINSPRGRLKLGMTATSVGNKISLQSRWTRSTPAFILPRARGRMKAGVRVGLCRKIYETCAIFWKTHRRGG